MPEPIVFWQMPPCWGLPNASPFCLKLETWLRMAGLPYEAKSLSGPPKSKSGKAPYLERADGTLVSDSDHILDLLTKEHGVTLDEGLTDEQRALATLVRRTFEESLYFHGLHARWVEDGNWPSTRDAYFAAIPTPVRVVGGSVIRRGVLKAAWGQGISRMPAELRERKAAEDYAAIAHVLGEDEFFFGRPSSLDAIAFAFIANTIWIPIESRTGDLARGHANLVAHAERVRERYWGNDWPQA